ncbi:MAG: hypothetical protein FJ243_00470 [Nitrospira sp.]|nr:hypothetical protein [Nitrospira sp.]
MSSLEAIKDGFRVVHRNWQLVLVHLCMVIINFFGFFIFVGIPLAVALIIFGIDLTGIKGIKDIFDLLRNPSEIISRYLGLIIIIVVSFLIYVLLVATLGIYVLGGSVAIIGRSLRDAALKFSMHAFFSEARRLFMRMLGFTAAIGLILISLTFVLGVLGGGIAAIVSLAKSQDSTLALFLGVFFSLVLILIAITLILVILSTTIYGAAALFFKGTGPVKSIREALRYLSICPNALWLYTILFAGYLIANFFLIFLGYPFRLIPVIGPIISFPYQLMSYALQTYLGLVIIGATFTYYYFTEILGEPQTPPNSLKAIP